jgi:hypothetical protein
VDPLIKPAIHNDTRPNNDSPVYLPRMMIFHSMQAAEVMLKKHR